MQAEDVIDVLLIEDNPADARLIREMLLADERWQFRLFKAASLREGIQALQDLRCRLILLDLSLPDSHGIETLRAISEVARDAAVVVLTGNDDEAMGLQAVQVGAQDYLVKSDVDSRLLVRSMRYAMERHRIESMVRRREQEYRSLIDDVFNTSMVAVLILDSSYRIVWCNEATEVYFSIRRERLIGRDSRRVIEEDLKCVFADPDDYSARLLAAYESGDFTDRFECHVTPESGREERWLEHWSQPIRQGLYAGGRIEQYTDITARKQLEIAEREQRQFTEALRDVAALITSTLDLNEVLERIMSALGRLVPYHEVSIVIVGEEGYLIARSPKEARSRVSLQGVNQDYGWLLLALSEAAAPLTAADLQQDDPIQALASASDLRAYMGAPIRLQQQTIGVINVFSRQANFYQPADGERLTAFAELAAIAIQNAQLFQRTQALAAIEERQRLARELHDSVSQTLFTTRTLAESALRRWDKDPQRARELTEEVYHQTATALAEMRILLFELRPSALTQISLRQLFEQYLQPIRDRHQFDLILEIPDLPPLPPEVQIGLYRIVQEALNNIDKHAQAQRVIVRCTTAENYIKVQIVDDGIGFDVQTADPSRMGLNIMRERAESINAVLSIKSQPGSGTEITVVWHFEEG
jgi:signal transduction histidine kinase/DNA-binding response OmpR family regulator